MTEAELIFTWHQLGIKLNAIESSGLERFNLSPSAVAFLSKIGLPADAAPFLSFVINTDDKLRGINRLTELYNIGPSYSNYILIGSDGGGNPIVIDTSNNEQIVLLDHEDNFGLLYLMNSSLSSLSICLLHYCNFIKTIIRENGDDAFLDANFTDSQFEKLKEQLTGAEPEMLSGFWNAELNTLLANREYYKTQSKQ